MNDQRRAENDKSKPIRKHLRLQVFLWQQIYVVEMTVEHVFSEAEKEEFLLLGQPTVSVRY